MSSPCSRLSKLVLSSSGKFSLPPSAGQLISCLSFLKQGLVVVGHCSGVEALREDPFVRHTLSPDAPRQSSRVPPDCPLGDQIVPLPPVFLHFIMFVFQVTNWCAFVWFLFLNLKQLPWFLFTSECRTQCLLVFGPTCHWVLWQGDIYSPVGSHLLYYLLSLASVANWPNSGDDDMINCYLTSTYLVYLCIH